jgi:hypothetical protein
MPTLKTLPDYLERGLEIISIGLNPSLPSVREGFYFAKLPFPDAENFAGAEFLIGGNRPAPSLHM